MALVRSNLEFGMLVWNPIIKKYTEALERVQRHSLKYMYYRIFQYYPVDVPYGELLQGFEMESLKKNGRFVPLNFYMIYYEAVYRMETCSRKLIHEFQGLPLG